jgi:hypothetical protein
MLAPLTKKDPLLCNSIVAQRTYNHVLPVQLYAIDDLILTQQSLLSLGSSANDLGKTNTTGSLYTRSGKSHWATGKDHDAVAEWTTEILCALDSEG